MSGEPWQLLVLKVSIKKKDKLRVLNGILPFRSSRKALDIGCAQGTLSYFLRRKGGFWVSTDDDFPNLTTARTLLLGNLVQTSPGILPFMSGAFDLVTCLDYLEHIDNDSQCLAEIARVLKSGGEAVLITPHTGKFYTLHKLRGALGLRLDYFGHKREGYNWRDLETKVRAAGLVPTGRITYSRFFSEFLELLLNFAYVKVLSKGPASSLRDGRIKPSSGNDYEVQEKNLRIYSWVYPLLWVASRLDALLFFQRGYSLVVRARK